MSQDACREFLQSKKHEDRYRFFLLATMLSQMREEIASSMNHRDDMDRLTQTKISEIEIEKAEVNKARQEYENAQQLEKTKERIVQLRISLAWAYVLEKEIEYKQAQNDLEHAQLLLGKYQEKMKQHQETEYLNEKKRYEGLLNEANNKVQAIENKLSSIKDQIHQYKQHKANLDKMMREIKREMSMFEKQKIDHETRVQAIREESSRDIAEEQQRYDSKVQAMAQKYEELNSEKEQKAKEFAAKEAEYDVWKKQFNEMQNEISLIRSQQSELEKRLRLLQERQHNRLAGFGAHVPRLADAIRQNQNKFTHAPLGPLAMYIDVKDPQWLVAIESVTKAVLRAYVVDNYNDFAILKELMKKCGADSPIIIQKQKNERYQVNKLPFESQHVPVLSVIEIENPWAYCVVIDQCNAELLLLDDRPDACFDILPSYVARSRDFRGFVQKDGGRVAMKGKTRYHEPPGRDNGASLLQIDVTADIVKLNEKRQALIQVYEEKGRAYELLNQEKPSLLGVNRKLKDEVSQLSMRILSTKENLDELERNRPQAPATEDTTPIEMEIKRCVDEISSRVDKIQALKEKSLTIQREEKELNQELEKHQNDASDAIKQSDDIQNKMEEFMRQHMNNKAKMDAIIKKRDEIVASITLQSQEVERIRLDYEDLKQKAHESTGTEQEYPTHKPNRIAAEIKGLSSVVAQEESKLRGDLTQIKQRLNDLEQKYSHSVTSIRDAQINQKKLDAMVRDRQKEWLKFRKAVAANAKRVFNNFLSAQGHSGTLNFDHENQALTLEVTPNDKNNAQDKRIATDTRSLSGGERSFTTLAFVMALGESIQSPFRALDEFDIFMDSVNRSMSVQLLLSCAINSKHRQFIFITPQDVSMISHSADVKLFRLQPPMRRQGVISNPEQQLEQQQQEE